MEEGGARTPCCANCGRVDLALKKCVRCKQASYCGAECQKAAWKQHKKACEPPKEPLEEVRAQLNASFTAADWPGVLKWEGRLDELMEGRPDAACEQILLAFTSAHALWGDELGPMGSRVTPKP